jgi:carbon-monoxide dehydrogenase iron sulfur subunit
MTVEGIVVYPSKCRGCRSCQLACSFSHHRVFNPAKSVIAWEREVETDHTTPMISPIACDLCGGDPSCVKACPYGALEINSDYPGFKIVVSV